MDHSASISLRGSGYSDPEHNHEQAPTSSRKKPRAKRYQCHLCSRRCVRPSELQEHLAMHAGHKPYVCTCGYATPYKSNLSRHQSRCETFHPSTEFPRAARVDPASSPPSEQDPMSPISEKTSYIEDDDFEMVTSYHEESPTATPPAALPADPLAHLNHLQGSIYSAEPDGRFKIRPAEFVSESSQDTYGTTSYQTPWPVSMPVQHPGWSNPVSHASATNPDTSVDTHSTAALYISHPAPGSGHHVRQFGQSFQSSPASASTAQHQLQYPPESGPQAYQSPTFAAESSSQPHFRPAYSDTRRGGGRHQTFSHADSPPSTTVPYSQHDVSAHNSPTSPHFFSSTSQHPGDYLESSSPPTQVSFHHLHQPAFQTSRERQLHHNEHASVDPHQYTTWSPTSDSYNQSYPSSAHQTFNSPPPKPPGLR